MKDLIIMFILFYVSYIIPILGIPQCKKSNPPRKIEIDKNFTINPIQFNNKVTTSYQVGNRIFTKETTIGYYTSIYNNTDLCPPDFIVPYKEDYENLIKYLGSKAYSTLTDPKGFNMTKGLYYITNSKGKTDEWFSFFMMYLDGKEIKISDKTSTQLGAKNLIIKCVLKVPETKIEFPLVEGDIDYNKSTTIRTNGKYFNGYLWKIGNNFYNSKSVTYTFTRSGSHLIEFWGNLINGEVAYSCDYAYVKKKPVSNKQNFNINTVKLIETDFEMHYYGYIYFSCSSSPVAPKVDGSYLIAVSDKSSYLHILHFDRYDNLTKDLNTTKIGYPVDIVETDYGFVVYATTLKGEASYLDLYNKNFELIKTLYVMNNKHEDRMEPSDMTRQIMRYTSSGSPEFGMRFMIYSEGGKLVYTKGRIFLIFGHRNFNGKEYHNGDSSATFNDLLEDIDFGWGWGTSHSLSQSATFDEKNYISASLNDAISAGINVYYLSKTEFLNNNNYYYDPVNKKYNLRSSFGFSNLTGYMRGYKGMFPMSRMGGILYFESIKKYCLVYAKTPNYSNDDKNNTNIIYLTAWELKDKKLSNNKTIEVKVFPKDKNVLHVRVGKLGDDKAFIIYNESQYQGNGIVTQPVGEKPKVCIVNMKTLNIEKSDIFIDNLYMNSNEDLDTFNDGVLIWATSNKEGKLVINKIGTPRLNESFDDIDYILTKDDLTKDEKKSEEDKLSGLAIFGIIIGVIFGLIILLFVFFILYKFIRRNKNKGDMDLKDIKGSLMY